MTTFRLIGWTSALALLCQALPAWAANWGPIGHPKITYDLATSSSYAVPDDVAKVMALGATAPDFFEFGNPAAHAQTPDPEIGPDGRLAVDRAAYEQTARRHCQRSEDWHRFYLDAAKEAMHQGHRERAAFLLGYAMHNAEDLPTHQGLSNMVHSAMDRNKTSPDEDLTRIALAHMTAKSDMEEFRKEIGEENWKLFRGQAVRGPGLGSKVPEPLTRFGDLSEWNPRSGVIPPSLKVGDSPRIAEVINRQVNTAWTKLYGQAPNELEHSKINKAETWVLGLYTRQDDMLEILKAVPRVPGSPPLQTPASLLTLNVVHDMCVYTGLAGKYDKLPPSEQKMLGEVIWLRALSEKRAKARENLEAARRDLIAAHKLTRQDLEQRRGQMQGNAKETQDLMDRLKKISPDWARQRAHMESVASAGAPSVDVVARNARIQEAFGEVAEAILAVPMALASSDDNSGSGGSSSGYRNRDNYDNSSSSSPSRGSSSSFNEGKAMGQLRSVAGHGWGSN